MHSAQIKCISCHSRMLFEMSNLRRGALWDFYHRWCPFVLHSRTGELVTQNVFWKLKPLNTCTFLCCGLQQGLGPGRLYWVALGCGQHTEGRTRPWVGVTCSYAAHRWSRGRHLEVYYWGKLPAFSLALSILTWQTDGPADWTCGPAGSVGCFLLPTLLFARSPPILGVCRAAVGVNWTLRTSGRVRPAQFKLLEKACSSCTLIPKISQIYIL